jgi:predicted SprT family Zn-dependent metalloprotease
MVTELDLTDIASLVRDEMNKAGLTDWYFEWDRGKTRAGACHYRHKKITLSEVIFSKKENAADVLSTILHEIAHALVGPNVPAHGWEWQRMARSLGIVPDRCHSYDTGAGRYIGTCGCETPHYMHRRPKYLQDSFKCRACGESFFWEENTDFPTVEKLTVNDLF